MRSALNLNAWRFYRYTDRQFPPYRHRLGKTPHPMRHRSGHMYGLPELEPPPFSKTGWKDSESYLYGIDLFNFRYFWEAHEAWEGLWTQERESKLNHEFLRGLIQTSAAMLKREQQAWRGAATLLDAGTKRLRWVASDHPQHGGIPLLEWTGRLCESFSGIPQDWRIRLIGLEAARVQQDGSPEPRPKSGPDRAPASSRRFVK